MSVFAIVLLVAAVALVVGAQWPRFSRRVPRPKTPRLRRKPDLRLVEPQAESDDDFVRAVERDLAALPTIDEQDAKNR